MNVYSVCVKTLALPVALLISSVSLADTALPAAPDPLSAVGRVAVFLLLIIGIILLLAWLVNKTQGQRLTGNSGKLTMVAVLPLGMKEKIAVIQVGSKQLLVGITPQQITTLAELDEPLPSAERGNTVSFQELLKKAVRS